MAGNNECGIRGYLDVSRSGLVLGNREIYEEFPELEEIVSAEAKGPSGGAQVHCSHWDLFGQNWLGLGADLNFPIHQLFRYDDQSTPEGDTNVVIRERSAVGGVLRGGSIGPEVRVGDKWQVRGSAHAFLDASTLEYVSGGDREGVPVAPGRVCDEAQGCEQRNTNQLGAEGTFGLYRTFERQRDVDRGDVNVSQLNQLTGAIVALEGQWQQMQALVERVIEVGDFALQKNLEKREWKQFGTNLEQLKTVWINVPAVEIARLVSELSIALPATNGIKLKKDDDGNVTKSLEEDGVSGMPLGEYFTALVTKANSLKGTFDAAAQSVSTKASALTVPKTGESTHTSWTSFVTRRENYKTTQEGDGASVQEIQDDAQRLSESIPSDTATATWTFGAGIMSRFYGFWDGLSNRDHTYDLGDEGAVYDVLGSRKRDGSVGEGGNEWTAFFELSRSF